MTRQTMKPSFHLLELNIMSAQDLAPIAKTMRTYAVVWVHPDRKLTTRVDQTSHSNPTWNEKFVFRVDNNFLRADTSSIMIEIYTAAWLRDVLVGSVNVLISNLFASHPNKLSSKSFVALQIRRPSGRPQGILNMGFTLLDSTMKSMPLYSAISASGVGVHDLIDSIRSHKQKDKDPHYHKNNNTNNKLRRSQSDKTDLTTSEDYFGVKKKTNNGSNCTVSVTTEQKGSGSMVNDSLCSDVGPSASLVAAAIAKGLIKTPAAATDDGGSSILEGWTEKDSGEGVRTKLERWRTELPPIYDHEARKLRPGKKRGHTRRQTDGGGGLFSCFGNVFGCEISITCGGGNSKRHGNKNGKVCNLSSVDDNYSESYV